MSGNAGRLRLYNTLTRTKEDFVPIDPSNVRMYVCGPTVYDFAHIGNARPAIVFDVVYRLLRHVYGEAHVTYVRNITDVDDKINARALRDFGGEIEAGRLSLNEAIRKVTETTNNQYQKDVLALGCLPPTHQPRATEFVAPRADGKADMISLIERLIAAGHAYVAAGEVLFDTASMPDYGQLSRRRLDEQQAGARVEVEAHKKSPGDFVLWKLSSAEEPGWPSPWGRGRPGWHIECSAMSAAYLGDVFDIHGGGLDLIFPHHENEIAQSRCAHGTAVMANYWMHNGFLQVEGRKMSKSEGNFVTIHELLETETFGGRRWPGEVLRLAMLMTHYREPIDFSVRRLEEAENIYRRLYFGYVTYQHAKNVAGDVRMAELLLNDLDTVGAVNELHRFARNTMGVVGISDEIAGEPHPPTGLAAAGRMISAAKFLGLLNEDVTGWVNQQRIQAAISKRLDFIREKNWPEADRIRDQLLAEGVQLKDGKNPETGERITTWEVRR